jgi:acyl transferase domain-containing protein
MSIKSLAGSDTAAYVGIFNNDYKRILHRDPDNIPFYQATGTGEALLANRLSYFFDLKGPSLTLDTGCSGSLVALHLACRNIQTGESKQAIVGGVNLILDPQQMISMSNLKWGSQLNSECRHLTRNIDYFRRRVVATHSIVAQRDMVGEKGWVVW